MSCFTDKLLCEIIELLTGMGDKPQIEGLNLCPFCDIDTGEIVAYMATLYDEETTVVSVLWFDDTLAEIGGQPANSQKCPDFESKILERCFEDEDGNEYTKYICLAIENGQVVDDLEKEFWSYPDGTISSDAPTVALSPCAEKLGADCVKWNDTVVFVDNTFTRFNLQTTFTATNNDGSSYTFTDDPAGTYSTWPQQLDGWQNAFQAQYPNAIVEVRCNILPNGCGGKPPPSADAIPPAKIRYLYVSLKFCPTDSDIPVSISFTNALNTKPRNLVMDYTTTPVQRGQICRSCGEAGVLQYLDGTVIPQTEIPACYFECSEVIPVPPAPVCTFDAFDGCDSIGNVPIIRFIENCDGELATRYMIDDGNGGLTDYTLLGDFVDCETGDVIPTCPPEIIAVEPKYDVISDDSCIVVGSFTTATTAGISSEQVGTTAHRLRWGGQLASEDQQILDWLSAGYTVVCDSGNGANVGVVGGLGGYTVQGGPVGANYGIVTDHTAEDPCGLYATAVQGGGVGGTRVWTAYQSVDEETCVEIQQIKERDCEGLETYRFVTEDGNGVLIPYILQGTLSNTCPDCDVVWSWRETETCNDPNYPDGTKVRYREGLDCDGNIVLPEGGIVYYPCSPTVGNTDEVCAIELVASIPVNTGESSITIGTGGTWSFDETGGVGSTIADIVNGVIPIPSGANASGGFNADTLIAVPFDATIGGACTVSPSVGVNNSNITPQRATWIGLSVLNFTNNQGVYLEATAVHNVPNSFWTTTIEFYELANPTVLIGSADILINSSQVLLVNDGDAINAITWRALYTPTGCEVDIVNQLQAQGFNYALDAREALDTILDGAGEFIARTPDGWRQYVATGGTAPTTESHWVQGLGSQMVNATYNGFASYQCVKDIDSDFYASTPHGSIGETVIGNMIPDGSGLLNPLDVPYDAVGTGNILVYNTYLSDGGETGIVPLDPQPADLDCNCPEECLTSIIAVEPKYDVIDVFETVCNGAIATQRIQIIPVGGTYEISITIDGVVTSQNFTLTTVVALQSAVDSWLSSVAGGIWTTTFGADTSGSVGSFGVTWSDVNQPIELINIRDVNGTSQGISFDLSASCIESLEPEGTSCVEIQEIKERDCEGLETYRFVIEDGSGLLIPYTLLGELSSTCPQELLIDPTYRDCVPAIEVPTEPQTVSLYPYETSPRTHASPYTPTVAEGQPATATDTSGLLDGSGSYTPTSASIEWLILRYNLADGQPECATVTDVQLNIQGQLGSGVIIVAYDEDDPSTIIPLTTGSDGGIIQQNRVVGSTYTSGGLTYEYTGPLDPAPPSGVSYTTELPFNVSGIPLADLSNFSIAIGAVNTNNDIIEDVAIDVTYAYDDCSDTDGSEAIKVQAVKIECQDEPLDVNITNECILVKMAEDTTTEIISDNYLCYPDPSGSADPVVLQLVTVFQQPEGIVISQYYLVVIPSGSGLNAGDVFDPTDPDLLDICPDGVVPVLEAIEVCYEVTVKADGHSVGDIISCNTTYDVSAGGIGTGNEVELYTTYYDSNGAITTFDPANGKFCTPDLVADIVPCGRCGVASIATGRGGVGVSSNFVFGSVTGATWIEWLANMESAGYDVSIEPLYTDSGLLIADASKLVIVGSPEYTALTYTSPFGATTIPVEWQQKNAQLVTFCSPIELDLAKYEVDCLASCSHKLSYGLSGLGTNDLISVQVGGVETAVSGLTPLPIQINTLPLSGRSIADFIRDHLIGLGYTDATTFNEGRDGYALTYTAPCDVTTQFTYTTIDPNVNITVASGSTEGEADTSLRVQLDQCTIDQIKPLPQEPIQFPFTSIEICLESGGLNYNAYAWYDATVFPPLLQGYTLADGTVISGTPIDCDCGFLDVVGTPPQPSFPDEASALSDIPILGVNRVQCLGSTAYFTWIDGDTHLQGWHAVGLGSLGGGEATSVDWGDGNSSVSGFSNKVAHEYTTAGTYTVIVSRVGGATCDGDVVATVSITIA